MLPVWVQVSLWHRPIIILTIIINRIIIMAADIIMADTIVADIIIIMVADLEVDTTTTEGIDTITGVVIEPR